MQSCELISFVTAIACGLAQCYTTDELLVIIAMLNQLTDSLSTIIVQETFSNKKAQNSEKLKSTVDNIVFDDSLQIIKDFNSL